MHTTVRTRTLIPHESRIWVNDIHSRLNATRVGNILALQSLGDAESAMRWASSSGRTVCVAGGRHAMGAQQFATDAVLLDTRGLGEILRLDRHAGTVEVQAGIQWPELIGGLRRMQPGVEAPWTIIQKPTGADRLTLGGCVSANIHGRVLGRGPLVDDIEALTVITPSAGTVRCSRTRNPELFRHVIGGYGLFGLVYSVKLRLTPRLKLERRVEVRDIDGLAEAFAERTGQGCLYGDFQFATDDRSPDFLRTGVFSCYRPVPGRTVIPAGQRRLLPEDWHELLHLAHADKSAGFARYAGHYLETDGQVYGSDDHQLAYYEDHYHERLDTGRPGVPPGSEMISELYVPRSRLATFLGRAATELRARRADVIYGTVRMIEQDTVTALPWAREDFACVIFNLHVTHSPEGMENAAGHFRRLIDLALTEGGSYYLTYHRWARPEQVQAAYPGFHSFLTAKRSMDPGDVLQSTWYRHHAAMFADNP